MSFTSMSFALFLPIAFLVYWGCPQKFRHLFLLGISYFFYITLSPAYTLLLLFTTLVAFYTGLRLEQCTTTSKKKRSLAFSLLLIFAILFFFKYFNFAASLTAALGQKLSLSVHPLTLKLLLPAGISFYTFQTAGYLIDVYKGTIPAEHHFGYYALFVSFFPQITSGPIGRAGKMLPQFKQPASFDYQRTIYGLSLMVWGFFKKLVVAALMQQTVDKVYNNLQAYIGLILIVATVMFAIQIYCDFSGYTDIARGVAILFGIELAVNFKNPYFSHSIKEFWSRWHISLSTWFRDYLYIPLGGNRVGKLRHNLNLLITFLVSGLWHGANLTFLIWGGIHGLLQIIENTFFKKKRFPVILTFITLCITWVFFRANTFSDAITIFKNCFTGVTDPAWYLNIFVISLSMSPLRVIWVSIPVLILLAFDLCSLKFDVIEKITQQKFFVRWPIYIAMLLVICLFSQKGVAAEFIYNQF